MVRIIVVLTSLIPGSFVPISYFIAYFILDKKPEHDFQSKNSTYSKVQETLDESKVFSKSSFKSCSRKFSGLHERLRRIEAYVTSSRFKLDRKFRNI
jgi:phage shock protein C